MAVFDWLPADFDGSISFLSHAHEYSYIEQIGIKHGHLRQN